MAVFAVVLFLFSCEQQEITVEQSNLETEATNRGGMIVLGKKLENPYSVENMKKAYDNLIVNGRSGGDIDIATTHYYVRFLPKSNEEMQVLEADSLYLFDYPLDYEIEGDGENYVDPDVNIAEGKWFYTSVPINYNFTNIKYEIIEDLFLPEEYVTNGRGSISNEFLLELEDEALRITGNYEERDDAILNGRAWENPNGHVRVFDTERNRLVGVEGVKVRTRRWFKYGNDYTDGNGFYYITKRYKRDVHYTVFFKNVSGFKVWSTVIDLSVASHHVGKHSKHGYDINIFQNSRAWRFATVNNGVVKYKAYCSQFGINHPPSNLRIAALDKASGGSATPMLRRTWGVFGFTSHSKVKAFLWKANSISISLNLVATLLKFTQPDIIIKAASSRGTATVLATTFHECAHASHWTKAGNGYWVKYINYIITYNGYGNGTGNNAGVCGIGEMWGNYFGAVCMNREFPRVGGSSAYLDEFEDWYNPGFLQDVDNIPDVSTAEIFSCLTSSTDTFDDLINQLKTKTNNDAQVDNAFANYTDWP